jgi:hypothetical protein
MYCCNKQKQISLQGGCVPDGLGAGSNCIMRATQEWSNGQSLREDNVKLTPNADHLTHQTKAVLPWQADCSSCMDLYKLVPPLPNYCCWLEGSTSVCNVCLEQLCSSKGVGLWVHSICCRECTKPVVQEGVSCWSHAHMLRLQWRSEGIWFYHRW